MHISQHHKTRRATFIAVILTATAALFFIFSHFHRQSEAENSKINRKQWFEFASHALSIDAVIQAYRAARRDSDLPPLALTTELLRQHHYLKSSAQSFKVTFVPPLSLYDTVDITNHSDIYAQEFCSWLRTYENHAFFSDGVYVKSCGGGALDLVIET